MEIHQRQHGPQQVAANQLDIAVDTRRAGPIQAAGEIRLAAVEAAVNPSSAST